MKFIPRYLEEKKAKFSGAISLKLNMNALDENEAKIISDYMESCIVIDQWLSNIHDVITNRFVIPNTTWSDGVYIWHSSHIHYVRTYRARLPIDFVVHVKKQLAIGFSKEKLSSEELHAEYEGLLDKLMAGDESMFDGSYN
jgi:hypothetical protein